MKKHLFTCMSLAALALFTACKSQESAYRQAYLAAQNNENTEVVTVVPQQEPAPVTQTYTQPVKQEEPAVDNTPVRTIQGGLTVIKGDALRTYSVIVGSFMNQTNAEGLYNTLTNRGYNARVVRTNETINGHTGWYRVAASSYDDKGQAVNSRNGLKENYPDAWLLFNK